MNFTNDHRPVVSAHNRLLGELDAQIHWVPGAKPEVKRLIGRACQTRVEFPLYTRAFNMGHDIWGATR